MISGDDFQPRKIYGSLSLHKSTLEYIWVEPCQNDLHDGAGEWMGSFVDFTALKVLCSSLANLVELDELGLPVRKLQTVLLSSLETLYVSVEDDQPFNIAIDLLAELAALKTFPKLATIHLQYCAFREPENAGRVEWLEQRCQETGILYFSPQPMF
ncbi:hypothetical protein PENCOP_c003G04961 [Penicillium coprophilum]|uniref:F-box domain-containing protein n=1 Tax=Penicillium coprophilum TaxID=36646 RepID=A0A1V6UZQ2_9EURO|nr:hypothetical protein PENCOP_c003G04961 [Penicillium coprophilum]